MTRAMEEFVEARRALETQWRDLRAAVDAADAQMLQAMGSRWAETDMAIRLSTLRVAVACLARRYDAFRDAWRAAFTGRTVDYKLMQANDGPQTGEGE